jgi:uncharacterized protein YbaR (Trm112 family)
MAKCHFRLKSGEKCGETTEGQKRKCEAHYDIPCSVCGKPAWITCQADGCDVVLCRKGCQAKHVVQAHDGVVSPPKDPDPSPEAQQEAPEPVPVDALACPACEGEAHAETARKGRGKDHRKEVYQVVCPKCRVAGPVADTLVRAVSLWDRLPRGRPAVYEGIRTRSLALIDKALKGIEKRAGKGDMLNDEAVAVAKLLEAATMAVDTWEL